MSEGRVSRELLISVAGEKERQLLLRFLREHGCDAEPAAGGEVVVDDCDRWPGLATLVALVEEWRSSARVAETTLRLGDSRTILRTEV